LERIFNQSITGRKFKTKDILKVKREIEGQEILDKVERAILIHILKNSLDL